MELKIENNVVDPEEVTVNGVTYRRVDDLGKHDDVQEALQQLAKIRYVQDKAGVNFHVAVWALGFIQDYPIAADCHY